MHGPEKTDEWFDINGGGQKRSGDPDQNSGAVHKKSCKWDPAKASKMAFDLADSLYNKKDADRDNEDCDGQDSCLPNADGLEVHPVKRGALCVGEIRESDKPKRTRANKKDTDSCNNLQNLRTEAANIISKMVEHKQSSSYKKNVADAKACKQAAPVDKRLADESFVFDVSLRRYVRNCLAGGTPVSLDAVHNLAIVARGVSAKAREDLRRQASVESVRTAKFRTRCSSLIVALWSAACASPYMENAKRGSDAFRPFVCGCLYAFKRGLFLSGGQVLIPKCPELEHALPALRATGGNVQAKALHSSSHRGMCTLSKCISSIETEKQQQAFSTVTSIAESFAGELFSKFDI